MHELKALESRLVRLETANRRWRTLFGVGALGAILAVATSSATPAPATEVVRATSFVLVGQDGAEVGTWKTSPRGKPYFRMVDGQASAFLTMDGPSLSLRGSDGKRGSFLGVDTSGESRLELRSERYVDGARLIVRKDGTTGLFLLDSSGRERATIEHLAAGNSQITSRDSQGKIRSTLGTDANGIPNLLLMDSAGRRRLGMLVQTALGDLPVLSMEDEKGRSRFEVTMDYLGEPSLRINKPDGGASFRAP